MAGFTKYMVRASTVLSAIHVRLIHASVWLTATGVTWGPSVAFERQRRIAAGGWQRPVFFSVEVVAGRTRTEPVQSRDIGGVFHAEGGVGPRTADRKAALSSATSPVSCVRPAPATSKITLCRLPAAVPIPSPTCNGKQPRMRERRTSGSESAAFGSRRTASRYSISGQKLGVARLTRFDIFRGLVELLRNTTQRAF